MKIIRLTAENVKRLHAVEITPDGTVQVITGRNAQGKTSVLDAIWLALGGGAASRETPRPIRDGADHASVTLDLGDLVVTRTWTGKGTQLTVTAADGARYASPQGMLDALVGRLSFDPLAFTRLSARDQATALLDLVDLDVDLDDLAHQRQALYDQRTDIGRQSKALGTVPAIDPDVPETEQSASDIIGRIQAAQEQDRVNATARSVLAAAEDQQERLLNEIARLNGELKMLDARVKEQRAVVDAAVEPEDVDELTRALAAVEDTNSRVRENAERCRRKAEHDRLHVTYEDLTEQIDALDQQKADALAAAEFPVEGLGFDDGGVTFGGVPFSQASAAEQIRVSLAMAMALNPRLRVIRILDGSLLDADNLALIADMARDQDYQVWIERVSDRSQSAVVIEDGAVQEACDEQH